MMMEKFLKNPANNPKKSSNRNNKYDENISKEFAKSSGITRLTREITHRWKKKKLQQEKKKARALFLFVNYFTQEHHVFVTRR